MIVVAMGIQPCCILLSQPPNAARGVPGGTGAPSLQLRSGERALVAVAGALAIGMDTSMAKTKLLRAHDEVKAMSIGHWRQCTECRSQIMPLRNRLESEY